MDPDTQRHESVLSDNLLHAPLVIITKPPIYISHIFVFDMSPHYVLLEEVP